MIKMFHSITYTPNKGNEKYKKMAIWNGIDSIVFHIIPFIFDKSIHEKVNQRLELVPNKFRAQDIHMELLTARDK